MKYAIEKIVALFCIIVFLTFLINHGHINFAGVDWVKDQTVAVIKSDEGQQYIQETKEISKDVFRQLFDGVKHLVTGDSTEDDSVDNTLECAKYLSTVDGDTIKVEINGKEKTVRLIGIDAPESVNPDASLNTEYGKLASEYTKTLLENVSSLYLEYDVSTEDNYGRTLAYVWVASTTENAETNMLNAILVKNGYANDTVYLPNNKYADVFMNLRMQAEQNKTGLWQYKEFAKITGK